MFPALILGELAVVLALALLWVVSNAILVTRLRRNHNATYESIGAPGILWNPPRSRNSGITFVFSSQWRSLGDVALERTCRLYRIIIVAHLATCLAILMTLMYYFLWWIIS
jgi:hypothetical protein